MSLEKNLEKNILDTKDSYNVFPYVSKAYPNTLPNAQNLITRIIGLDTADIGKARVLEIGCSYGGNILSFAMGNPEAEVIGIDLSEHQIEQGQKLIEYLGLKNIKLYHKNILDFDESFGKFDYIVCHGVFSWVPEIVQDKILEVIRKHLAENGSAIISYNTYPGWKRLEVFKDAMNYRVKMLKDAGNEIKATEKVSYGKGILEFMEKFSVMSEDLKKISAEIREKDPYYLEHEYYEINNRPMYLYEFNQKVENAGLIYVADSEAVMNHPFKEGSEVKEMLDRECGDNYIAKVQYYDFLKGTQFRRSILTHKENKDKINYTSSVDMSKIADLYIVPRLFSKKEKENTREKVVTIFENLEKEKDNGMIKIKDFAKKYYKEEEYREIFEILFSMIFIENLLQATFWKKEINKQEKVKINDYHLKMLDYILSVENSIVGYGNLYGYSISADKNELAIMTLFNGEKTDEEIVKHLEEVNIKEDMSEEEIEDTKKTIVQTVKNMRYFIEKNFMNV